MKVNVGCGDYPAPKPWVNVDQYQGGPVNPDVVADARHLPFDDGSVDAVYCGHLLEHLTLEEGVPELLAEIRRVLKPTGRACFVGPDWDRAVADPQWEPLLPSIRDGGNRWPGDKHLWLSTATQSLDAIRTVFPDASEADVETLDPYWPIPFRVTWQFAIVT